MIQMHQCYYCQARVAPADQRCLACNRLLVLHGNGKMYRIVEEIGKTNLSLVYKAIDTQINRVCAIKSAVSPMFQNESAILLQHASRFPFIPHIYDIWSDGLYLFLVMEYIHGRTLDQVEPHPWTIAHVRDFLGTLLVYVGQIHAAGIIHRDIKPRNIMYTPEGRTPYMLLDFGIAKQSGAAHTIVRNFGTPDYAPPEQFNGQPTDVRSDLYSLAATSYHLLMGAPPPTADERQRGKSLAMHAYLAGSDFEDLLYWMMELNPARRPPSANLVLHRLNAITVPTATHTPIAAASIHFAETTRNPTRPSTNGSQPRTAPPPDPTPPLTVSLLHTLQGHRERVNSVAFSPDGQLLASGSDDRTVRLWDMHEMHPVADLKGFDHWVNSVAFSPTAPMLVTGSSDEALCLWRIDQSHGRLLRAWNVGGFLSWVHSVIFSPDGKTLASGSGDPLIRLWSVADGTLIRACLVAEGVEGVLSVAFSPDGRLLASGTTDTIVRLWHVLDGSLHHACVVEDAAHGVLSVAFSPDGRILASACGDGSIRLWRVSDGALLSHCPTPPLVNGLPNRVRSLAFSPDGQLLASGSSDTTVRLWHIPDGSLVTQWKATSAPHRIRSLAFSPAGTTLATGSDDSTVRLWHLAYTPRMARLLS